MVEHLVQFQRGLGSSPGPVTFHAAIKTKEQAFRIGNEIANTITLRNPAPIKLKFEKVGGYYRTCVWKFHTQLI